MGRLLATFGVAAFLATKAAVFAKTNGITDGFVTLGKPLELYITADHAYVVTRDDYTYKMKGKPMKQTGSIHTFVLQKSSAGWRITGEAWASTASAAPVSGGT